MASVGPTTTTVDVWTTLCLGYLRYRAKSCGRAAASVVYVQGVGRRAHMVASLFSVDELLIY
jgi:hypothetical protein